MLRAVLIEPEKIILEEVEKPKLGKEDVLLKVQNCGICGSDLHAYYGKHPFAKCPVVQGHEFSACIEELGKEVKGFKVGQKVVVEPSLTCGECYQCKTGRYNICDKLRVMGFHAPGCYAEHFVVPAEKIVPIPDDMDYEAAAMVEPTAVAVHAIKKAGLKGGEEVAVIGCGPIGVLIMQVAKAMGAKKVFISDIVDYRLEMAKKLGANKIHNPKKEELADAFKEIFPNGPDVIFEVSGNERALVNVIKSARKGSKIVIVAVYEEDPKVPISLVQDRELELIGTLMYMKEDWEKAVDLIYKGKIQTVPLISTRFNMKELQQAYKYIEQNPEKTFKVMIKVSQD